MGMYVFIHYKCYNLKNTTFEIPKRYIIDSNVFGKMINISVLLPQLLCAVVGSIPTRTRIVLCRHCFVDPQLVTVDQQLTFCPFALVRIVVPQWATVRH